MEGLTGCPDMAAVAREASALIASAAGGAVDLWGGGCRGCGECCGRFLPVTVGDMVRLRGYVAANRVRPAPERAQLDLLCPFLSQDRECLVYEARPEVCRLYRCDLDARHEMPAMARGQAERLAGARVVDMREAFA